MIHKPVSGYKNWYKIVNFLTGDFVYQRERSDGRNSKILILTRNLKSMRKYGYKYEVYYAGEFIGGSNKLSGAIRTGNRKYNEIYGETK